MWLRSKDNEILKSYLALDSVGIKNLIELPDSFTMAKRRLPCLEAKIKREPKLYCFLLESRKLRGKSNVMKLPKHNTPQSKSTSNIFGNPRQQKKEATFVGCNSLC